MKYHEGDEVTRESHEERLREMGLFSLQKRIFRFSFRSLRFRGNLTNVFEYLMEKGKESGTKLFSVVSHDRKRDDGHKLKGILFKCKKSQQVAQKGSEVSILGDI